MESTPGLPPGGAAPVAVDRLEITVVVDNVTDSLSTVPDHVRPETRQLLDAGVTEISGESICCAHHGLSLLITVHRGDTRHTMLFDAGPEGYGVERNADRLGLDFGAIEAVVLSHGHWDHAGGLPKALELIEAGREGPPVPFYLHPGMFRQRGRRMAGGSVLPNKAVPSEAELAAGGARTVTATEPTLLLHDTVYLSGEVPRVTPYERGLAGHVTRAADGEGWEDDPLIMDERFIALHVKEKGLVVFTACSHAGVINVLAHAKATYPAIPLHAVMGGFHLSGGGPEKIIPETVRDLAGFGLRWIVPCHCTGWRAVHALLNAFGEAQVTPGAVGKRFTF